MLFILNLLDSSDVVVVLSQLLLIAQAVVPVTQLLISGRTTSKDEDSTHVFETKKGHINDSVGNGVFGKCKITCENAESDFSMKRKMQHL